MSWGARRWLVFILVVMALGTAGLLYQGWIVRQVQSYGPGQSHLLFALGSESADGLEVQVNLVQLDSQRGELRVRLDFLPGGSYAGSSGELTRSLRLRYQSARGVFEQPLLAGRLLTPIELAVSLRGSPFYYPSDVYSSLVDLQFFAEDAQDLSVRLKVFSRLDGFEARKEPLASLVPGAGKEFQPQNPGHFLFLLQGQRSPVVKGYARLVLGLQWLLTLAGLGVTLAVVIGGRRPDPVLWIWVTALLVALPLLRGMLVGAPQIGIYLDFLGFLAGGILLTLSLLTLVATWVLSARFK